MVATVDTKCLISPFCAFSSASTLVSVTSKRVLISLATDSVTSTLEFSSGGKKNTKVELHEFSNYI